MPRRRYPALVSALRAALGTPLEPAAKQYLASIVFKHITNDAIAAEWQCDPRTVRKLLPLYGWPNTSGKAPRGKDGRYR